MQQSPAHSMSTGAGTAKPAAIQARTLVMTGALSESAARANKRLAPPVTS